MPPCTDTYVLTVHRNQEFIGQFLDEFLPRRRVSSFGEQVPRFAKQPERTFRTAEELLAFLLENPEYEQVIYYSNLDAGDPEYAVLAFTNDGKLILGLSCAESHEEVAAAYRTRLKTFAGSEYAYSAFEYAPDSSTEEFMQSFEAETGG